MLNQTVIVGRLVDSPEVRETESGKKVTNITLAVQRSYKNEDGEYDTDFVDCTLWQGVAENTAEYCRKCPQNRTVFQFWHGFRGGKDPLWQTDEQEGWS